MAKFVLTAQLKLAAPTNVKSVVSSIQKQLNGVKVDVQVGTTVQAVKQINNLTSATKAAGTAAENMGSAFGVSLKRFAAFSVASRAIGLVATKLSGAVDEAIAFQNEMVRLSQVTGKTLVQLKSVSDQIGSLASTFGVSSKEILGVTSTLAQAGIEAQDLTIAINALAKTALAPSFGKIQDTAEGAIAVIAQFGEGVGALERQLGAINRVSAQFAVESQDLITVIRTTGGVFKASGGDLEDLLALFTSVRATTRESAESIATGLRTIFTRIQRPETIRYLQQFGVELTNVEGKFVGPYEAVRQLSAALSGLGEGDIRFIKVAEELGGFRQIGKVIPLLRQFEVAEKARQAAIEGGTSLDQDVATAQQSIQVQFTKTREAFLKLIRDVSDTSTFKVMISTSLQLANTLIKVADAIKPLIPLITTLAAIKFAQGIGGFFAGIGSGFKKVVGPTGKNKGGKIHAFAKGGLVPGTGNRDTVPAMLSPGEFVIRKSSVESIGAENLANVNKYAAGGIVTHGRGYYGDFDGKGRKITGVNADNIKASRKKGKTTGYEYSSGQGKLQFDVKEGEIGAFVLSPAKGIDGSYRQTKPYDFKLPYNEGPDKNPYVRLLTKNFSDEEKQNLRFSGGINAQINPASYPVFFPGRNDLEKNLLYAQSVGIGFQDAIRAGINSTVKNVTSQKLLDLPPVFNTKESSISNVISAMQKDSQLKSSIEGYLFEGMISAFTGATASGGKSNFDFSRNDISKNKSKFAGLFGGEPQIYKLIKGEAKRSYGEVGGNIQRKLANDIIDGKKGGVTLRTSKKSASGTAGVDKKYFGGIIQKFAKGGAASDTVPALLTPGEFVVNKQSAQSIGYGALDSMNKKGAKGAQGVQGFATGGKVHRFGKGGKTPSSSNKTSNDSSNGIGDFGLVVLPTLISNLAGATSDSESAFSRLVASATSLVSTFGILQLVAGKLGVSFSLKTFGSGKGGLGDIIGGFRKGQKGKAASGEGFSENFSSAKNNKDFKEANQIKKAKKEEALKAKESLRVATAKREEFLQQNPELNRKTYTNFPSLNRKNPALKSTKAQRDRLADLENNISSIGQDFQQKRQAASDARNFASNKASSISRGKPTSLIGKLGRGLGNVASKGGVAGRAAQLAGGALRIGGGAAGALGGGALAAAAGPIAGLVGGVLAVNAVFEAFQGYTQKANKAIEEGNVARAKEYSVLAAAPGIISAFGEDAAKGYIDFASLFGGDSAALVEANAASQALAAKYNKEYAANAKASSDALADVAAGTKTLSEVFASGALTKNLQNAINSRKGAQEAAKIAEEGKSTGGSSVARNIFSGLTFGLVESSDTRNNKIDAKSKAENKDAKDKFDKEFEAVKESVKPLNASLFAAGKSVDEVVNSFKNSNSVANEAIGQLSKDEFARFKQELVNQQKAIQDNIKFLQAANLGLREVSANSGAAALALENIGQGNKNRSSTGVALLEASLSDMASALNPQDVATAQQEFAQVLSKFGASDTQVQKTIGNFKLINDAQKGVPQAFKNTLAAFDAGNFNASNVVPEFKKQLVELAGGTEEGKKQLADLFANVELKPEDLIAQLKSGDYSGAVKELFAGAKGPLEDSLQIYKDNAKITEKLNTLNQEKLDLEKQYVDSKKASIAIELEARQAMEDFGGPVVTAGDRLRTLNDQINADLSLGGNTQIGAGSADDILRVQQTLENEIASIGRANLNNTGSAFSGATPESANKEQALRDNAKSLLDYNRQRLAETKEELAILQKKNALEKSAFEKLLGGDIQGAIEDQAASAAAEALKSGNVGLAKLFGPQALAGGLKSLEGQGLTQGEQLRAAQTAGATVGASSRLAKAFSGTTPEELAKKQEGQELASSLNAVGKSIARTDQMAVDAKNVVINAANRIANGPTSLPPNLPPRGVPSGAQNNQSSGGSVADNSSGSAPGSSPTQTAGEIAKQSAQNSAVAQAAARAGGVSNTAGISSEVMAAFNSAVSNFALAVNKLESIKLNVKIDPTNVNVNINGGLLANLSNEIRNSVLDAVAKEIPQYKMDNNGTLTKGSIA